MGTIYLSLSLRLDPFMSYLFYEFFIIIFIFIMNDHLISLKQRYIFSTFIVESGGKQSEQNCSRSEHRSHKVRILQA